MRAQSLTDAISGGWRDEKFSRWAIFAGIALLAFGIAAVVYDITATILSVFLFGCVLIGAGCVQFVHAFQVRDWNGFFLHLLDGLLRAAVGTLIIVYPGLAAVTLTLVLSFYFVVGGLFRAIGSVVMQYSNWGWAAASGLVSVGLGAILAMQWPVSGLWFIGFAVGFDLILHGWGLLMFGAAAKKLSPSHA
jgi:uncharacterized membrane protein HdeD (DUF308 family)